MKLKRICGFFLFLTVAANVYAFASSVEVKTKESKYTTKYFKAKIKTPVIIGMTNKKFEKEINSKINTQIETYKNEILSLSKKYYEEAQKENFKMKPYIISTNYDVKKLDDSILSILIHFYEYTGGAHGNYFYTAYNIDLQKGLELSLSSLFKEGFDYNNIIKQKVLADMDLDPQSYFKNAKSSIGNLSSTSRFYLEKNSLVIYYDLYEIAPFSTDIPLFKIPLKSFSDNYLYSKKTD